MNGFKKRKEELFSFSLFLFRWNGSYNYCCFQVYCYSYFSEEGSSLLSCALLDVIQVEFFTTSLYSDVFAGIVLAVINIIYIVDLSIDFACSKSHLELEWVLTLYSGHACYFLAL